MKGIILTGIFGGLLAACGIGIMEEPIKSMILIGYVATAITLASLPTNS